MNLMAKRNLLIVCGLVTFTIVIGCNQGATPEVANVQSELNKTASPIQKTETVAVDSNRGKETKSPAVQDSQPLSQDSTPSQVCQKFMTLLQNGNRIGAENLLTRAALTSTSREGLVLEPLGGPDSKYEFGETRYATNKQNLAQVDCKINDFSDGSPFEMELTWVIRKQATGWRISGVMLELEPGKVKDFLSFENSLDVIRMKQMAGVEDSETLSATQASATLSDVP
ncbi:MAG: hypothetical protein AAF939_18300 [Planctomycetota bacterium]